MPNIELKNVSRIFPPDIVAVDDISFKINSGEYVFMLGPSGCGKTTTLRLISGLDTPTNGKIFINNKPVIGLPPEKRNMGFVFQNFEIFNHMTVWENATYGLEVRGYEHDYILEKGIWALKMTGLFERADEYPNGIW